MVYFLTIYHKNQPTDQLQVNIPTIHGYYADSKDPRGSWENLSTDHDL